jgi:hypothetical protein
MSISQAQTALHDRVEDVAVEKHGLRPQMNQGRFAYSDRDAMSKRKKEVSCPTLRGLFGAFLEDDVRYGKRLNS